jgi:Tat protein translocase TatB subunit
LYLFIFESIGTSELILIGVIALIVFGPRKLPQMAKTIGKTMADFRRTTNEFKSTWEKEAEFYKEENIIETKIITSSETVGDGEIKITQTTVEEKTQIDSPEIKELDDEKIKQAFSSLKKQNTSETISETKELEKESSGKRDWL